MKDPLRGNEIKIGSTVAYNHSGYMGHGEVIKLVSNRGMGWWPCMIHVRNSVIGGISKVKDKRSVLVLFERATNGQAGYHGGDRE